jgi:hypothetical protein
MGWVNATTRQIYNKYGANWSKHPGQDGILKPDRITIRTHPQKVNLIRNEQWRPSGKLNKWLIKSSLRGGDL